VSPACAFALLFLAFPAFAAAAVAFAMGLYMRRRAGFGYCSFFHFARRSMVIVIIHKRALKSLTTGRRCLV
jgi:hypothetical protein